MGVGEDDKAGSEYGIGLSPNEPNPENAVRDLVSFLPVLAYALYQKIIKKL